MSGLPLPPTFAHTIEREIKQVENPGLLLDRYVQWGHGWTLGGEEKRQIFETVVQRTKREKLKKLADAYNQRWEQTLTTLTDPCTFEASPEWRLIVGLGGTSVLETTITLHRIYGLPFIPGSAIKGMTRAYAELVAEAKTELINRIFGPPPSSPDKKLKAGEVIFLDAIPLPPIRLAVDVMNPHYGEWYLQKQKKIAPGDYLSPVPVAFLTVEKGTRFRFALAARRPNQTELVKQAEQWVRQALNEIGIGGKTAAGYGFFDPGMKA